jgi:hypothetical protein
MKLSFFSRKIVSRLHDKAGENMERYGTPEWLDAFAGAEAYIFESSQVVDPAPELLVDPDDRTRYDAENARRVFSWLRTLTPALAMEERLWAYLTHCVFPDYMSARWPATKESIVQERYLLDGASFGALSRNGISRLWWSAFLTRDPSREDPFELTNTLFVNQDVYVSVLERSLSKCPGVRTTVLEYIRDNYAALSQRNFGKRIQTLLRELNLLGGVAILDALPPEAVSAYLEKVRQGFAD